MNKIVCISIPPLYQDQDYVGRLLRGVQRNLTVPFEFEVRSRSEYPGWWSKLEIFPPKERIVFLDLDIIITGNCDFLFDYDGQFCAWRDPWSEGLNSSVMSIAPGFGKIIKESFLENPVGIMRRYHGDQDWINMCKPDVDFWPANKVKSYKADNLESGPREASICIFHGHPKPHEMAHLEWVRECWR